MAHTTCIVLDLDDTLYAERDYVRSGFTAVERLAAERIGIHGFGDACWQSFVNGDRGHIFDAVLQSRYGLVNADLVSDMVRAYRAHKPSIELHSDARRFVKQARRRESPLSLITDGPRDAQRAKIAALGINRIFSPIVVTAELGEGKCKPHPAAFELVQAALGADNRFVYVADNPNKDFLAPNRLGWTSIRIQRPCGLYSRAEEPTPEHAPHHRVALLDDVWRFAV